MVRSTRRQFMAACSVATAGIAGVNGIVGAVPGGDEVDNETTLEGTWQTGPAMPDERTEVRAATLEDHVYVFGGFVPEEDAEDPNEPVTNEVAVYDSDDEVWGYAEPMPEALHHISVASTADRIYVIGGHEGDFEAVDSVWMFDGEEWDSGTAMPTPRGALTAGLIDDRIYVAGGVNGEDALRTLEAYDIEADEWADATEMPTPREHLASGVVDDEFYVLGGRVEFDENEAVTEVYDPETDEWEERTEMPTARSGHDARAVDGRIYVFGGESPERTFDETEVYDPETDEWDSLESMPTPRHGLGTGVVDGDIYTVSGGPEPGFTYSDVLEILELESE